MSDWNGMVHFEIVCEESSIYTVHNSLVRLTAWKDVCHHQIVDIGKLVNFCWIVSLICIYCNNLADMTANSAFQFKMVKCRIPCTKFYKALHKLSLMNIWVFCDRNKLYSIQNKLFLDVDDPMNQPAVLRFRLTQNTEV